MNQNPELEKLKKELKELEERYNFLLSAVDNLPNPIFMKDRDARFFFFNRAYSKFFEMERNKYIGTTVLDLDYLPPEEREKFQKEDLRMIEELDTISYDTSFQTSDGREHPSFYWSSGFMDEASGNHGLVGEIVDISKERVLQKSLDESLAELKKANEKLKVMAETDPGSGLYNRTILWEKGEEIIRNAGGSSTKSCMLMIDVDKFKEINDEFGHLKGDDILVQFADLLRSECRPTDMPIRYGGDEFLLILYNIDLENGIKVGERIRSRCEKELMLPSGKPVTVSVGVIEINDSEDFEKNLSRLDNNLYKAKTGGRNRVLSE